MTVAQLEQITRQLKHQITDTVWELMDYIDWDSANCPMDHMVAQLLTAELNVDRIMQSIDDDTIKPALFGDHQDYVNQRMGELNDTKVQIRMDDDRIKERRQKGAKISVMDDETSVMDADQ